MDKRHVLFMYGDNLKCEQTKAFLPDMALADSRCIDSIDDEFLQLVKKEYATSLVLLIRGGLGMDIGFWERMASRRVSPAQIIVVPTRIAFEPPVNGVFESFQTSPVELTPPDDPYVLLTLDFVMSHGVTLYEILHDPEKHAMLAAREAGMLVTLDRASPVYQVDDGIVARMRDDYSVDTTIGSITDDIRSIKRGETAQFRPEEAALQQANQIKHMRVDTPPVIPSSQPSPPTKPPVVQGGMSDRMRERGIRKAIRQRRQETQTGEQPVDIEFALRRRLKGNNS